ncbi:sugar phosphate isomerase/epimerase family protein [Gimesia fumaroli]|uniref:Inosose isomerase n=1 Tax=Gimesia fumaroli TaxID=2527976 RepID=A0A518IKZ5_9PLAN|nr:sugar phosphate isomerase/epimerase family protein [Gimesia fumaroli]QDV53763.1 Inosose isomerase [Gimesia fumaroli]
MQTNLNRREMLAATGGALAAGFTASPSASAAPSSTRTAAEPFGYCFNTSTIRGQKLGIVEQIDLTSKAGYDSIEPWMRDIDDYVKGGGSLADLKKRLQDAGLTVESAIGFAQWIVDDDAKRKEGLEQARRDMDTLRQIGGIRIAAPPTGATNQTDLNLFEAAKRYRALLELGDQMGVTPQVEVWGFSKSLSRLGESMFVAIESGHPQACLLPDVYHIYKGGSDFEGLGLLSGSAIQVFHVNDYPADPPRETINDSHRVYPGDGVAPLSEIFRMIHRAGFRGVLSLELFNRDYWQQDPLVVAQTGLRKTREAVLKAKLDQPAEAD